jgi:serpin B
MKRVFIVVIMVAILLCMVACTVEVPGEIYESDQPELEEISESDQPELEEISDSTHPISGGLLVSHKQRIISPEVNKTELANLVDGASAFAFDLYQTLKETDGNIFYSPYSISLALAMTYAGARGETEQQMTDTLHFNIPQDHLHPAFNSLDIELSQHGEGAEDKDGEGYRLNIVNAIWGQKDYQFLSTFLDLLAENYGTGLRILDFAKEPEESRITINNWVSDQTEGRIKDLIPEGLIHIYTRLVLTNAIYFNAAWQNPFEDGKTSNGPFYLRSGDEVDVPMMKQTASLGYTEFDGLQAIELPYDGNEISMIILLPGNNRFAEFEKSIDNQQVEEIIESIEHRRITLSMPKFEFESSFSLKEALSIMGMAVAFSLEADFSGMAGNRDLYIDDVVHKTFISTDEAGTEAAAATAVIMRSIGASEKPIKPFEVTIDRPFVFFIRDIKTGTILFVGRLVDPSS